MNTVNMRVPPRRRLAALLVVAGLVTGGAVAAGVQLTHHPATPRPVGASPAAAPGATGNPAVTAPSLGATATSGPATPGTSNSAPVTVEPATVVDAAWLTAAELSATTGVTWRADSVPAHVMMGPVNNLGTCLSGDPAQVGAESQWQVGPGARDAAGDELYQVQYFYPDASAARRGLAAFAAVYAHCQGFGLEGYTADPHLVDTVHVTTQSDDRFAVLRTLRHPDGTPASTPIIGSDNHEYLVRHGNVIYFIGRYGNSSIDAATRDPQLLESMVDVLGNYWK